MKRTFINEDEIIYQQQREGFMPICCYGSIKPEDNELGGIFGNIRNTRVEHGLVVHNAECVERILIANKHGRSDA